MEETQRLERLREIKREIWQISESYTKLANGEMVFELTSRERKHCAFLHHRLGELANELSGLQYLGKIEISLVYKKMCNELLKNLFCSADKEYQEDVKKNNELYFQTF